MQPSKNWEILQMTSKTKYIISPVILFLCLVVASVSHAINVPEKPLRYIVDLAGIIDDATENRLNGYLQELEQKTTAQLVVLTIPSLEGESIEDFSITIANDKWQLGQKGKDNGVLFLIAFKDKKYRIEVGYGLEGVLPDSFVGSLGRNLLAPDFRKGEYTKGIFNTTLAVANQIATANGVKIEGMPAITYQARRAGKRKPGGIFNYIITIVFLGIILILFIKNPRAFLLFLLFSSMGGRRGSWGGGGGFGSFGGGGGGGFGGGGASGGW
jgi:uncharacterized protein